MATRTPPRASVRRAVYDNPTCRISHTGGGTATRVRGKPGHTGSTEGDGLIIIRPPRAVCRVARPARQPLRTSAGRKWSRNGLAIGPGMAASKLLYPFPGRPLYCSAASRLGSSGYAALIRRERGYARIRSGGHELEALCASGDVHRGAGRGPVLGPCPEPRGDIRSQAGEHVHDVAEARVHHEPVQTVVHL